MNQTEIARRLDLIRRQKGYNQEQLAEELGISQPAVSKYLKNRIPPPQILLEIAKMGQTTVEWILTGQKSYLFSNESDSGKVRDNTVHYDANLTLAKKIALLPAQVRQSIETLINHLLDENK
ncbi:MAG: helix-turn-helix domain-containing protein [Calditrichaceae bacterium]